MLTQVTWCCYGSGRYEATVRWTHDDNGGGGEVPEYIILLEETI
jgi:hypothetical protein